MNAPQKFLFDTSFEVEEDAAPDSGAEKPAPAPSHTAEELAQAHEEGFARGREAGLEAARAERESETQNCLSALEGRLTELAGDIEAAAARREQDTLRLTVAMLRRLLPRLIAEYGVTEIEAVVRDCFHRLRDEPRLVVRVADSLLDEIERRVAALASRAGFEGRIVFLAQEDMRPGDVLVEWADGGAERKSDAIRQEIEVALSRALNGASRSGAQRPPMTNPDVDTDADTVVSA